MNAGAYGSDMSRVTEKITLVNGSGTVRDIAREALAFTYRDLQLPDGGVIIKGAFLLGRGDREAIRSAVTHNMEERKRNHPLHYPSAGSVFKNPTGIAAGRIVEEPGVEGTSDRRRCHFRDARQFYREYGPCHGLGCSGPDGADTADVPVREGHHPGARGQGCRSGR